MAESYAVGAKVTEVAARHSLNASVLFTWRRRAIEAKAAASPVTAERLQPAVTTFVPVKICDRPAAADVIAAASPMPQGLAGLIEIAVADASIRVTAGTDVATLAMVLAAVRGGR